MSSIKAILTMYFLKSYLRIRTAFKPTLLTALLRSVFAAYYVLRLRMLKVPFLTAAVSSRLLASFAA